MKLNQWLIACCFSLITLSVQAAMTLEEQTQLKATIFYDMAIFGYFHQGEFKKALPWAKKSLKIRTKILGEKHVDTFQSLNLLALNYQKLGHLEEALSLADKGYHLLPEVEKDLGVNQILSLVMLTSIYRDLSQLNKALRVAKKSYSLTQAMVDQEPLFTFASLNSLAAIYYELGRMKEALPLLEQGVLLVQKMSDEQFPKASKLETRLRNDTFLLQLFGLNSKMIPNIYQESRQKVIAQALNNLAATYYQLGKLDEALPLYEKAYRSRLKMLGEKHPETHESRNNLAVLYKDLGRLSEALSLFEESYRLNQEVLDKTHAYTIIGINQLAFLYQEIGRLDEALPLFEKSYHLARDVLGEKHHQTLIILNNLAVIHRKLGDFDKALFWHDKVYHLSRETFGDKHPLAIASVNNSAEIYQALNRLEEALSWFEKAYQLAKEVFGDKEQKTITSLNNWGSTYIKLGRLDDALPLIEKSYRLFRETLGDNNPLTLASLSNLAGLYIEQGHTQKGIEQLEQVVAGVEGLRRSDLSAENRQAWFKQQVVNYFVLSSLYINQSHPFDAFRLAEMSKARTLLESLTSKLAAQQSELTSAEQQQLQSYEARLAFLNNRIAKALENQRIEEKVYLETEKNQWVNRFNRFHEKLMETYPKYAQLSQVQIVGAKEGANYLPADAVLISYLVNGNRVLAFTLQSDGKLTAHQLGEVPDLKEDVEDYRRRLSFFRNTRGRVVCLKNTKKDIQFLTRKFGKHLLEPLKNIIKEKSHWIISPDGPLALIPFETLRLEEKEQAVIAQHQITYVQSLSVLKLLQERDKAYQNIENRGTLLAMGAPIYQDKLLSNMPKLKGRTLSSNHEEASNICYINPVDIKIARSLVGSHSDPQRYDRAFRQLNLKWRNLPGAFSELKQLEALFQDSQARIYKQADATEANLQRLNQQGELAKYRYLVFSAHGYLSPQIPALSSIVLGQVNNPPGIDGYVTAGEWPGYDVKSDLMVLSACETGVGEVVSGEGVMGLPYAFYVAGNKNTILTLWAISDEVTTEFIIRFFQKLKAGMGQVEALTASKREFLLEKGEPYNNPAYWAAFVLYGI